MTTAHRPTWNPARGGESQGGFRVIAPSAKYSSRDMPAQLKMKIRQVGQSAPNEVQRRDLKRELQAREAEHFRKTNRLLDENEEEALTESLQRSNAALEYQRIDADVDLNDDIFDSDKEKDGNDHGENEESESEDDDSDDDNEELMRELERIKKEREEERLKKEEEEREFQERERAQAAMTGNPLLASAESESSAPEFRVKRRWDEDVVFRNQSRGSKEVKPRFINDTIRNDFHRRFLEKYIR
ncbi:hypothetical protein NDN08_000687 [Rhodosorus marinus]|uniref:Cwf15/Cwc15 cell cycle control protein n=1 Tax=Rhodosorus marinus TaxID=101924 RepID=A0AAV8UNN7_9RHOD|nr:hypothetical protein NDN08_000687 [Rhodosorus marinus]